THALIEGTVVFKNLGLVITDEQHRFGVRQRTRLSAKGENPDILVMTATPIPRTLAVILYGDLDISIIDEMPAGRKSILTKVVSSKKREKVFDFVSDEVNKGRQAYIVAPLIDESENINAKSAVKVYEDLALRFRGKSVALIHGALPQKEKEEVMQGFYEGIIDILVSTVVIEVGINVPNATVMVIENAERFGLAQLHQLRGRIGRGQEQSYCILINEGKGEIAVKRANIMVESTDGFYIAEKDLEIRGAGEFFGTKQHGIPDLKIADLVKNVKILKKVQDYAKEILTEDYNLEKEKNLPLKEKVDRLFEDKNQINI
ncbi:MAG: ATP-dependent DNA helicase RecG, partial [Anaerovoracaceae bacterium]